MQIPEVLDTYRYIKIYENDDRFGDIAEAFIDTLPVFMRSELRSFARVDFSIILQWIGEIPDRMLGVTKIVFDSDEGPLEFEVEHNGQMICQIPVKE